LFTFLACLAGWHDSHAVSLSWVRAFIDVEVYLKS